MLTSPRSDPVLDVDELYRALARRLERIVRFDVCAPEPVVEDACQFAWSRLVDHCDRVRPETALSWLATTAVREAVRLVRRQARELSLDAAAEQTESWSLAAPAPGPQELAECRERLELTRCLPERQQRLLWLQALGMSYAEISAHTGCTARTVERQLLRAKRSLRALSAT